MNPVPWMKTHEWYEIAKFQRFRLWYCEERSFDWLTYSSGLTYCRLISMVFYATVAFKTDEGGFALLKICFRVPPESLDFISEEKQC